MHLSIASPGVPPPPPPGDHGGFDHFALPRGGEFDHEVGLRGRGTLTDASLHCDLRVYRVGLFDLSSVPGVGIENTFDPTLFKSPPSPGGGVPWGMQLLGTLYVESPCETARFEAVAIFYEIVYGAVRLNLGSKVIAPAVKHKPTVAGQWHCDLEGQCPHAFQHRLSHTNQLSQGSGIAT